MSTAALTVDWSELPPELLQTIVRSVRAQADYMRFRDVCSSWRAAAPLTPSHLPREFPWLMLRPSRSSVSPHRRGFFDALNSKLHHITLPEAFPSRRCVGSSHGWLVLVDESPSIFIINPITRAKINLPPLSTFPNVLSFDFYSVGREYTLRSPGAEVYTSNLRKMRDSFIKKVILSHNPYNESNFTAFAILNWFGDLGYYKKGEDSWKLIEEARSFCEDVIYFDGSFYAVNKFGSIAICDVKDAGFPKVSFINMQQKIGGDMQYLVDAMGELLLITRYLELETNIEHLHQFDNVYKTVRFSVWRMDTSARKWEKITTMGDRVIFLGENSSFALLASNYPGCKGNRIYFADDYSEANYDGISGDHDVGFYNMEDGKIEPLPCYPQISHWPIWITPNPC